ncbi:unnamed protein product [Ambrosiozyma monospora]|uniref:Unnamed protein product n=1 Tax=Ambrosiozyma monospora TaxID=43982 RepID=A0ACB5TAH7_AMBMO|nr:unnamed protein product [Ambrosiozyma monospora]
MTLGELTKRTIPIGKTSKNFEKAKDGKKIQMSKREERKKLRQRARDERISLEKLEKGNKSDDEKERFARTKKMMDEDLPETRGQANVLQLQMDENGMMTYNQESTVVDRHSATTDNNSKERVVENTFDNPITSATYSKRKFTDRWTPVEVAELYKALSQWGTDFGLIAQLFPYRTRRQIKSKFLLEEKQRPHLIEFALLRKLPAEMEEYTGKSGKEFKSLDEYEEEMKQLKDKHEKEIKEMTAAKEKAKAEDQTKAKGAYDSIHGGTVTKVSSKSKKAVLLEFRKNEEVVGTIEDRKL